MITTLENMKAMVGLLLAVLLIGFYALVDQVRFAHDHQTASAEVLATREETNYSTRVPSITRYTTVRFVTAAGQHIEHEVKTVPQGRWDGWDGWQSVKAGETITVQYDPDNPYDIRQSSGWTSPEMVRWIIFFIISIAIIGVSITEFNRHKLKQ
jgi:hypothetical protein